MDNGTVYSGGRWGQFNNLADVWQSHLNRAQFAVAFTLLRHADGNGFTTVSVATIAAKTGLGETTVRNRLGDLRELGLLKGEPGKGGRGCTEVRRQIVIPPTVPDAQPSEAEPENCHCQSDSNAPGNCHCRRSKLSLAEAETVTGGATANKEEQNKNRSTTEPPNPQRGGEGGGEEEQEPNPAVPPGFAQFWTLWPDHSRNKVGRDRCLRLWNRRSLEDDAQNVVDSLRRSRASPQWARDGGRYIPKPENWLNDTPWTEPAQRRANGHPARGRLHIVRIG